MVPKETSVTIRCVLTGLLQIPSKEKSNRHIETLTTSAWRPLAEHHTAPRPAPTARYLGSRHHFKLARSHLQPMLARIECIRFQDLVCCRCVHRPQTRRAPSRFLHGSDRARSRCLSNLLHSDKALVSPLPREAGITVGLSFKLQSSD